jgi:hypothetical protein
MTSIPELTREAHNVRGSFTSCIYQELRRA